MSSDSGSLGSIIKPAPLDLRPNTPEWERLRQRARTNLYWFNAKVLNHEEIVPMTYRAHFAMCRFAERCTGFPVIDDSRVQLISVSRAWGKSTLITKGRTIQRLVQDRDWAAGIANEKQDKANAFLANIRAEFESNEFLKLLFPECIPDFKSTTWKSDQIVIQRTRPNPVNPSVLATGIGGSATGVHMSEWIVDDLLSQDVAENARSGSFTEIDKTNRWVDRLEYMLARVKEGPLTFIGTPWWPNDTYDYIESVFGRGEPEREFVWTLRLPGGEVQHVKLLQKGELAIFRFPALQDGRPVEPRIYNEEKLTQLQADNPAFYSAQVLLRPREGEEAAFKTEHLKTFEWESEKQLRYNDNEGRVRFERVQDLQIVMSIDPAISEKSTAARSAICVVGSNGQSLFLLEAWAARTSTSHLAQQILTFYQRFRPARIIIEAVAYQMALAEVLTLLARDRRLGILPIYEYRSGADRMGKMRIMGLEPYFRKGFIHYHPHSQREFFEEYQNFSPTIGNRTIDLLDALSFQRPTWDSLHMLGKADASSNYIQQRRESEFERARRVREAAGHRRSLTVEWKSGGGRAG